MIIDWVVDLMDALGAPGVGLAIARENLFPPGLDVDAAYSRGVLAVVRYLGS